MGDLGISS